MRMPYAPLFGIKVIGTRAEVVDETEGETVVGDYDVASGALGGQRDGFATEVGEGGFAVEFFAGEGGGVEGGAEGKGVLRDEFLAFFFCEEDAGGESADGAGDGENIIVETLSDSADVPLTWAEEFEVAAVC